MVPVNTATTAAQNLTFTAAMPLGVSGVRRGAVLQMEGVYREPARSPARSSTKCGPFGTGGSKLDCTIKAVAHMAPSTALGGAYVNRTIVGVQATYSSGLQDLVFGIDLTSWQAACWVLAHACLSWVMHDIIPGQRRTLLSTQVSLGAACPSMTAAVGSSSGCIFRGCGQL